MRHVLALSSLAVLAACASPGPSASPVASATPTVVATAAAGSAPSRQICHKETVVGTSFPQTVCSDGSMDANDLNVARNIDDVSRTNGLAQQALLRGGVRN